MTTNTVGARFQILLVAAAASLWSIPVLAQAPPARLADKDVKSLIEQVDEGRDHFEGNLDGTFKGSTLRRAVRRGEGQRRAAGLPAGLGRQAAAGVPPDAVDETEHR